MGALGTPPHPGRNLRGGVELAVGWRFGETEGLRLWVRSWRKAGGALGRLPLRISEPPLSAPGGPSALVSGDPSWSQPASASPS